MSDRCDREALEALVYDELTPERTAEVERHAAGCDECRDELAWLRAERAVMAERADQAPELPPELWAGVERRIAASEAAFAPEAVRPAPERRGLLATLFPFGGRSSERARWFGFGLATAAAAAAVMFVVMRAERAPNGGQVARAADIDAGAAQQSAEPAADDRLAQADRAIEDAEAAHLAAIAALEAAYAESRDQLEPAVAVRYDEQFEKLRGTLSNARAEAGDDMGARLRLLDAYAAHRRSMKSALARMQENE